MTPAAETLVANLRSFTVFARARLGNAHLAEDIVHDSLVKALNAANQPTGEADTMAWFYRILRNAIIDLHRRDVARKSAFERFSRELPETPDSAGEKTLCQCFKRLLPAVSPGYRALLQRIDLGGEAPADVAAELGLTRNALNVRLHRARCHLRELLARNCRACAKHGCLDCTCGENKSPGD